MKPCKAHARNLETIIHAEGLWQREIREAVLL